MKDMECYLDNSATTRCFDSVAQLMTKIMCEEYGNPSSLHNKGIQAESWMRYARDVIAGNLKVSPKEIVFTSGGTEAATSGHHGYRASGRSGDSPLPGRAGL